MSGAGFIRVQYHGSVKKSSKIDGKCKNGTKIPLKYIINLCYIDACNHSGPASGNVSAFAGNGSFFIKQEEMNGWRGMFICVGVNDKDAIYACLKE